MEFLVTMVTHVPAGTSKAAVDDVKDHPDPAAAAD